METPNSAASGEGVTAEKPSDSGNEETASGLNDNGSNQAGSPTSLPPSATEQDHALSLSPVWTKYLDDYGERMAEAFLADLRDVDLECDTAGVNLQALSDRVFRVFDQHIQSAGSLSDILEQRGDQEAGLNGAHVVRGSSSSKEILDEDANPSDFGGLGTSSGACEATPPRYRSFFRRFSFRGLTKGRPLNMFHKQHSDEVGKIFFKFKCII